MRISRAAVLLILVLFSQAARPQHHVLTIRSLDFANFTFPYTPGERSPGGPRRFTFIDGETPETKNDDGMYLAAVSYADVTGDGIEEAFVRVGIITGGSAMPNDVYIYTVKDNRPKLLWSFETGDRASGGFRKIYSEDGKLVVELYGKGTRINGKLYGSENAPACCAKSVTRTRYRWNGISFLRVGKSEIFNNPNGNSSPVR
jgi:hypothetical protein